MYLTTFAFYNNLAELIIRLISLSEGIIISSDLLPHIIIGFLCIAKLSALLSGHSLVGNLFGAPQALTVRKILSKFARVACPVFRSVLLGEIFDRSSENWFIRQLTT